MRDKDSIESISAELADKTNQPISIVKKIVRAIAGRLATSSEDMTTFIQYGKRVQREELAEVAAAKKKADELAAKPAPLVKGAK